VSGYADLKEGVTLEVATYDGFQGTSVSLTGGHRLHLPQRPAVTFDDFYVLRAETAPADLLWSSCGAGANRDLLVRTRATLQNGTPRAPSYADVRGIGGGGRLAFTLLSRPCD
jgi:hypothetical protein